MTTAAAEFKKQGSPIEFDRALGLCFGWFCYSKQAGEIYIDSHGDHFPDDELVKAVDGLMAKPAAEREINVEHAGGARGTIATAQALTEDVAKALGCDTGGNYGVIGSFRPDAELMKSIQAGERFCLSIEGKAYDVEEVAKSAGDVAATAHKRTMRKVELTKLAVVKAGAHAGASVALIKSARQALTAAVVKDVAGAKKWLDKAIARHERHMAGTEDTSEKSQQTMMDEMRSAREELDDVAKSRIAKATPALTSADLGHQHQIADTDEATGCTSSEQMAGLPDAGWHSHLWVKGPDGSLVIAMALGHTHTLATSTDTTETTMADTVEKSVHTAEIQKRDTRIATLGGLLLACASLPPEQVAFVKTMPLDKLEDFLGKSAADRATIAAPVYVCKTTGVTYFASSSQGEVEMAKALDAQGEKLAKAEAAGEVATFEKRAASEMGHIIGTTADHVAVLKAIDGKPLTEAERTAAKALIAKVDVAYASVLKAPGFGGDVEPGSPQDELDKLAAGIAKDKSVSLAKAMDLALDTPRGKELYAQISS